MTTSPASDLPLDADPDTPITRAQDVIALLPLHSGRWPQECLALIFFTDQRLGPCLTLPLPDPDEDIGSWAGCLEPVLEQVQRSSAPDGMFTVAYTHRTAPLAPEAWRLLDTGRPFEAASFLAETAVLLASMHAAAAAGLRGARPRELLVMDRSARRWGRLSVGSADGEFAPLLAPPEHRVGEACWLVDGGGTLEDVLASPVAVAAAVGGHPLSARSPVGAVQPLPGIPDLEALCGRDRARAWRDSFRSRCAEIFLRLAVDHDPDTGCWPPIPQGARRAPALEEERRLGDALARLARLCRAHRVRAEEQGWSPDASSPEAAALRASLAEATAPEDAAALAARLPGICGVLTMLAAAQLGPRHGEALRGWLERRLETLTEAAADQPVSDVDPEPTDPPQEEDSLAVSALELIFGRRSTAPDPDRRCALRFLLGLIAADGEQPWASGAEVGLSLLAWQEGCTREAHRRLEAAQDPILGQAVVLVSGLLDRGYLPEWLFHRD